GGFRPSDRNMTGIPATKSLAVPWQPHSRTQEHDNAANNPTGNKHKLFSGNLSDCYAGDIPKRITVRPALVATHNLQFGVALAQGLDHAGADHELAKIVNWPIEDAGDDGPAKRAHLGEQQEIAGEEKHRPCAHPVAGKIACP